MQVKEIKTKTLNPPQDNLLSVIEKSFLDYGIKEKSIIVVTSKVVSIWEGRCVKISEVKNKDELIRQEADLYIERQNISNFDVMLTIKNNILIPSAGIDESNANGYYILWPKNPFKSAKNIYNFIKKNCKTPDGKNLKEFGVIISDSHTTPLRAGITGIGISFFGFNPLRDYRNKKDIFGKELKMSQTNIVDSLAASAVYCMGEGAEQSPIAIIEDSRVEFGENFLQDINIKPDDDIYSPVIKSVQWKNKK